MGRTGGAALRRSTAAKGERAAAEESFELSKYCMPDSLTSCQVSQPRGDCGSGHGACHKRRVSGQSQAA